MSIALTLCGAGFTYIWTRLSQTREMIWETRLEIAGVQRQADLNAQELSYLRRDVDGHLQDAPDVQGRLIQLEADISANNEDVKEIKADIREIKGLLTSLPRRHDF